MKPSGRLLLRLPPVLHAQLQQAAAGLGISVNEFCVRRLSAPATDLDVDRDAQLLFARANDAFGPSLVGILLYGSWVRGEASDRSDVDVLIVVDRQVELTRSLYSHWDTELVSWRGHVVDAHFSHLPGEAEPSGGIWAEAAVEGRVLFERDYRLSAQLERVRRAIADGRLVRRMVHGQSYWTTAA